MDFLASRTSPTPSSRSSPPTGGRWSARRAGSSTPFYSPGSDFIGYTNKLHQGPDLPRPRRRGHRGAADFYNFFYFQLFEPTISLYKDQYQLFGNPQVMLAKTLYDNTAYFATLAFMFPHEKMTDLDVLATSSTRSRR